jgi:hypothetical protein
MAEQYANFATTTLNGSINNSTTSVVVTNGAVFPSNGNFRVTIETEIMLCTSRSSNTLTVLRGQEGTTAVGHTSGLEVKSPLTKASIKNLIADNILEGSASSRPSASQTGRLYLPNNEPILLRDTGTAWEAFGPIVKLWNPNDQSWSWGNQGSATLVTREFSQTILTTNPGSGLGLLSRVKTVPSVPYKVTALFSIGFNNSEYQNPVLGMKNSSENKEKWIRAWLQPTAQPTIYVTIASNWAASGISNSANTDLPTYFIYYWLQIEDDNTNHYFRYSLDGLNYLTVLQHSRTTHMNPPDYLFWGTENDGATGQTKRVNLLSWHEE